MVKKLFALASFTALTGMVVSVSGVGCSSSDTTSTTDAAADVKKTETGPVEGGEEEDAPAGTCPDSTPVTGAQIDSEIGWKGPNAIQNPCSGANIQTFGGILDDDTVKTWDDLFTKLSGAGLPTACHDCIVTDSTAAKWGPVVKLAAGGGLFNFGACFANQTSDACGKTLEYTNVCINNACADCTSDATYQTCAGSKGTDTACAGPIKDEQTACAAFSAQISSETSTLSKACNNILNGASTLCAGGTFDGGSVDAGGQ